MSQRPSSTTIDSNRLWQVMGSSRWDRPVPFGPDGWTMTSDSGMSSVIATCSEQDDGHEWIHASIAHATRTPLYEDLTRLHRAVFGTGWAYQVFAPPEHHVNIHQHALHLWGLASGERALPNFGRHGSI